MGTAAWRLVFILPHVCTQALQRVCWPPKLTVLSGMLALFIIAHPDDNKFKNWIVRTLQMDWVSMDREELDVRSGFWKGVGASNIRTIFAPLEEAVADTGLLLDYTQLFGCKFTAAQHKIKPYIREWAHNLDIDVSSECEASVHCSNGDNTDDDLSSLTDSQDDGAGETRRLHSDGLEFPDQDIVRLRKCLNTVCAPHVFSRLVYRISTQRDTLIMMGTASLRTRMSSRRRRGGILI